MHVHRFRETLDHILRDDNLATSRGLRPCQSFFCEIAFFLQRFDAVAKDIVEVSDSVFRTIAYKRRSFSSAASSWFFNELVRRSTSADRATLLCESCDRNLCYSLFREQKLREMLNDEFVELVHADRPAFARDFFPSVRTLSTCNSDAPCHFEPYLYAMASHCRSLRIADRPLQRNQNRANGRLRSRRATP